MTCYRALYLLILTALSCQDPKSPPITPADKGVAWRRLGLAYENGTGVPEDLQQAAHYYQQGCEAGDAHSCGSYGVLLFYGHGIDPNPGAARRVLEQSCAQKYGEACTNLGIIYALGRHVSTDKARAAAYFEQGCALGSKLGCSSVQQLKRGR